ncbi:nucleoside triphosphate pyrophosphohydrolase family protein [Desulforegula conservatrix]|uniref:hypothetical protein n=1 Tax=Desulforegula conservatrix TaxID=153026 RepID=UPI00040EC44A|nr:hypothetical protein [Desulforegula conservatrix]
MNTTLAEQVIILFGWEYQIDRLVEECLEAGAAGLRLLGSKLPQWHREKDHEEKLIKEIADVLVVLDQFETRYALDCGDLPASIITRDLWVREFCTQCSFTASFMQLYHDELKNTETVSGKIIGMAIGRASDVKTLLNEVGRFFPEEEINKAKHAKENRLKNILHDYIKETA